MATSYASIYERFLPKLTDYSYVSLTEAQLEANLKTYLNSSIVKFRYCKKDLSNRDENLEQFKENLNDEEQEILAVLMIIEYLSPKLISSDLLQQTLSSKDFKLYSQANHIKEIRELRDMMKDEAGELMINYNYYKRKLDDFV